MKNLLIHTVYPIYHFIKNKNLREYHKLCDKWGKTKRYKKVNNIKFLSYIFDVPDTASFISQFKELFVDESYKFNCKNDNPVIYDCGSNVGTSCLYFKMIYPNAQIKAFEADAEICKILKTNLSKNNINDVEVINSAVWVDSKGLQFSSDGADGGSIYGQNNANKVNSISLKDILKKAEKIDMLKIDIEGAEYDVLLDCQDDLGNVEHLFVEYHSWNNSPQKLSEILHIFEKNNFRYYIESVSQRKHPMINRGETENMDLQLNIFGVKR